MLPAKFPSIGLRSWEGRSLSRRGFMRALCATLPVFSFDQLAAGLPLGVQFVNVAQEAGLHAKTIFGNERKNKFLRETTGCACKARLPGHNLFRASLLHCDVMRRR